jgi:hypothetical protein
MISWQRQALPHLQFKTQPSGLYYKPITIVNDDSRVINKLEASLTDDARVVIYNHHMFIVQATAPSDTMSFGQKPVGQYLG